MSKYIVKEVVDVVGCDYGIYVVDNAGIETLVETCNSKSNAEVICEIFNADLMKDGVYTVWKDRVVTDLLSKLKEKEKEIKDLKVIIDGIDKLKQYGVDSKQLVLINPNNIYASGQKLIVKTSNQVVIAELEKVKKYIKTTCDEISIDRFKRIVKSFALNIDYKINQRISELKGEK